MLSNCVMSIEERTRSSDSASTGQFSLELRTKLTAGGLQTLEAKLDTQRVLEAKIVVLEDKIDRFLESVRKPTLH